jgi:putative methanogen marker protein 4
VIVGIGVASAEDLSLVRRGAAALDPGVLVRYYCTPEAADDGGPSCAASDDPAAALVGDLVEERIDAAVRGTLPANRTLALLRRATGVDRLERVALLECADGRRFLFAPVGVDEGWSVAEKVALIGRGRELARLLGLPPGVGVLSGGRLGDIGRHPAVDRSMADAELAARLADAEHAEILIEEAVERCGLVIAPDGISGNLVFRTLAYLGGGNGHGAPVTNIRPVFIDTSRASADFAPPLRLAARLAAARSKR